jgi:hypothetical protein
MGFESFKKFTSLVRESVVKQNTNYRQATGVKERVALCIRWAIYYSNIRSETCKNKFVKKEVIIIRCVNICLVPSQHTSIHPSHHMLSIFCVENFNLLKRITATHPKQHGDPVLVCSPWIKNPCYRVIKLWSWVKSTDSSWLPLEYGAGGTVVIPCCCVLLAVKYTHDAVSLPAMEWVSS